MPCPLLSAPFGFYAKAERSRHLISNALLGHHRKIHLVRLDPGVDPFRQGRNLRSAALPSPSAWGGPRAAPTRGCARRRALGSAGADSEQARQKRTNLSRQISAELR